MKASCWLSVLVVAGLTLGAIPEGHAKKKKPKVKTEVTTLLVADLTSETKAAEVKKLKKAVLKVKGVTRVTVNKGKGELVVRHGKAADAFSIRQAVEEAGFEVGDREDQMERPEMEDLGEDYE